MRQLKTVVAGAVALCLAVSASSAFACDEHKASAASASHSGCASKVSTVSMEGKACGTKASMVSIFKDAPGTKTRYKKVDGGVALVVTAASKEYVPVVQNALLSHVDGMKVLAGQKVSAHCATEKASAQKAGSCAYKTETASVQKVSGSSCCASKGASKVTMQANAGDCPDWMKVLCGADMTVQKTDTGVTITWTSTEKNKVDQLRAAGEKLHADLAQL